MTQRPIGARVRWISGGFSLGLYTQNVRPCKFLKALGRLWIEEGKPLMAGRVSRTRCSDAQKLYITLHIL